MDIGTRNLEASAFEEACKTINDILVKSSKENTKFWDDLYSKTAKKKKE